MIATKRLYWVDDHCLSAEGLIVGVRSDGVACDQTCFYAGGGGQPPDRGTLTVQGRTLEVTGLQADEHGVLWHLCSLPKDVDWLGHRVSLEVNAHQRLALSRHHTVLHILNTVALRDYGAWITGAQIGVDYARIDFKWDGFSASVCGEVQAKVNAEIKANRPIRSYSLGEEEFSQRPDLLRTLEVKPPVIDGRVRVVEIDGFDAQACGGTHVRTTGELGCFVITKADNKGKINKRLYVRL